MGRKREIVEIKEPEDEGFDEAPELDGAEREDEDDEDEDDEDEDDEDEDVLYS